MNGPRTKWEPGMWDPDSRDVCRQWWESANEQASFMNSVRVMIGLEPLPWVTPDRRATAKAVQ